ncbi:MAG: hypothetical protein ACRDGI_10300 [Candidatus Limnocylindrales bacterium]
MGERARDEPEIEALLVDRYLESILVDRDRGARLALLDARLDPTLRSTADRLSAELIRVHPSFRFEERLARRLAEIAVELRLPAVAGGEVGSPRPRLSAAGAGPGPSVGPGGSVGELLDPARAIEDGEPFGGRARPILIGGALTSAAVSLAGAAFVAWRLTRPVHPMVRAIRAIHRRTGHEGGLA